MIRDILTKKPFARALSNGYMGGKVVNELKDESYRELSEKITWQTMPQADFLREFYPSGHRINNPQFYPNLLKYDEEKKTYFEERISRVSFPFQMIITIQHLIHLCGNDIKHELTDSAVNEKNNELFLEFRQGWLDRNMEVAFYEFAKSVKITGDGAIVYFMHKGKVCTKTLSFLDGDTLFPQYDSLTGEMSAFARLYSDYGEDGKILTSYVEVWDSEYMYTYRRRAKGARGVISDIKDAFGLDSYELIDKKRHGFPECPIVYHRDKNGPCWSFVQDAIEKYEESITYLFQNNKAYAFPIMYFKGEDVNIVGDKDNIYSPVKAVTMGQDDDAGFLSRPESVSSFQLQIETLLKMIFMGSFTVMPPEVKSGDLPGIAVKLIYSPSLERAMADCTEFNPAIDKMNRLFLYGWGIEQGKSTQYASLHITSYATPYVHHSETEIISNLVQSCGAGILSKETGAGLTGLGMNNEWDRLIREKKEEQAADLLFELKSKSVGTDGNS